mgnify:CR=1 FL=1|tara:strand:- start:214 stop:1116 length:903 start_codon:yes stop_codon:yes gene_type:complete
MNSQSNLVFSIITPTYNRAEFLERIWKTLSPQSIYISEWIVIDDGSTDKTFEVVSKLQKISSINIIYQYSPNRGMTSAINIGLKYVNSDYFFKLDSDDYLSKSSLKIISDSITRVKESEIKENVNAYSFLSSNPSGKIINKFSSLLKFGKYIDKKIITADYISARFLNWISGDILEIFESYPLLDHFRYPIFSDERNSPSGYMSYFNSDLNKGKVAYILEVALIKDYQENGVSFQRKYNKKNTSYDNFKTYLTANICLLKISEYNLKPFFIAIKEVSKLFLILFSTYILKFLKLIFKKLK